jgi:glycosyltransferase involved in cell wall biosynthesis
MPALTAGMDMVTLSSSHGEALSMTIGEAMACGVPCVATDVGDTGILIGNTGRVVEPKNPQALADAWEYILNLSNKEYKELGSRARTRVVEFYNVKTMTGSYKAVYREVNNVR